MCVTYFTWYLGSKYERKHDICLSGYGLFSLLWWSPVGLCPLLSLFACICLPALPSAMLWCSTMPSQTEQVLYDAPEIPSPDCKLKETFFLWSTQWQQELSVRTEQSYEYVVGTEVGRMAEGLRHLCGWQVIHKSEQRDRGEFSYIQLVRVGACRNPCATCLFSF